MKKIDMEVLVKRFVLLVLSLCVLLPAVTYGGEHNVTTTGSCTISGRTAEQAQILALRRARSAAVEKAAGVAISSSTLVVDGSLAGDFIKSFSQGYIISESHAWKLGEYQPDKSKAPIPEYHVTLAAVVVVPDKKRPSVGLQARLNQQIYRAHKEKLVITAHTAGPARLAVFNITANDQVVMLYPDAAHPSMECEGGEPLVFPDPKTGERMLVATLPGHKRDTEALLVAAMPVDAPYKWADAFIEGLPMALTSFFQRYATFAPHCEDAILSYEVFTE